MVDKEGILLFFGRLLFTLIIFVFLYIFYNMLQEICISLFMIYLLEFLNILINNINMKKQENEDMIENNNVEKKKINEKYSNIKFFSYGMILSGLFTFFISG